MSSTTKRNKNKQREFVFKTKSKRDMVLQKSQIEENNNNNLYSSNNTEEELEKKDNVEEEEEEIAGENNNIKNLDILLQMPSLPSPIQSSEEEKEVMEEFNNPLISESDLSIGGPYDPKIINHIDRFGDSDHWFCNNCTMLDDKWGMMKHICRFQLNKGTKESEESE